MSKSNLSLLIILTLIILIQVKVYGQSNSYSPEVRERILRVEKSLAGGIWIKGEQLWSLKDRMQYYSVMGLSIAVVNNYKIEWAKGYGYADTTENRFVTANTLFQAGSVSKSVNAIGILKLVNDKKIDLNTDINSYLNSWKFNYDSISNGKKITPIQLISHTSGLSIWGFDGYDRGDTIPTIIEILEGKKPANSPPIRSIFEPGLKFQYSGGGSTVSQLMIADVAKMSYDKFMLDNVLKPIGMTNSFFGTPLKINKIQALATAYSPSGAELPGKYKIHPEMAAAGLWTTPTDISKFIIESQLSYEGKSNKILSKEIARLMLDPYIVTNNSVLPKNGGLGVFIEEKNGKKYFLHKGGNAGFVCIYYGSMEGGKGVAVMINSNNDKILQEVVNSVSQVYDWDGFYIPIIKTLNSVGETVLESYAGNYEFAPNVILTITKVGNHLQAKATGFKEFEVFPETESKFFAKDFNAEIEFLKDDENKVYGLKYGLGGDNDYVRKRINYVK
jgi:CubicO group peptidase (beta-lactamase class C family)